MTENNNQPGRHWWNRLSPWQDAALVSLTTFLLCMAGEAVGWIPRIEDTWSAEAIQFAIYAAAAFPTRFAWLIYKQRRTPRVHTSGPVTTLPRHDTAG